MYTESLFSIVHLRIQFVYHLSLSSQLLWQYCLFCFVLFFGFDHRFKDFYVSLDLHTLGIWNATLPNGLAVPEASMYSVQSTADVLELMNIGLMNRAVCSTALNERSSRSHRLYFLY